MATKVLGLPHDTFHFPFTACGSTTFPFSTARIGEKQITEKPCEHDCSKHRSWRCVWCEGEFCFECDTGTSAPLDLYANHRLCSKHYLDLPGKRPSSTYKLHASQSGTARPFSIDLKYIPNRFSSLNDSNKRQRNLQEDKLRCHCLISKTLLCKDCIPHAKSWRAEEENLYNESEKIKCAFGRFPGNCPATTKGQTCLCHGRGVNCDYIPDEDLEEMESKDLQWLGRFELSEGEFVKKEKKNLRSLFGESFPRQSTEELSSSEDEIYESKDQNWKTEPPKPDRALFFDMFGLKESQFNSPHESHRQSSSLSSSQSFHSHIAATQNSTTSLENVTIPKVPVPTTPQYRKPYSNFKAPPVSRKLPKASISSYESFLDSASEDETDDENNTADTSSFLSISSISDHEDEYKCDFNHQIGLTAPPPVTHVATATVVSRQITPRLIHMKPIQSFKATIKEVDDLDVPRTLPKEDIHQHDSPRKVESSDSCTDIKPSLVRCEVSQESPNIPKWGCQEEVQLSKNARQTWEAHGFWRCSFCDGRIRGV